MWSRDGIAPRSRLGTEIDRYASYIQLQMVGYGITHFDPVETAIFMAFDNKYL
jgi:hypothetical protein